MKPLVLIVPETTRECHCCGPVYAMPDGSELKAYEAERMAKAKRFTTSELAAEYWCAATEAFHVDTELAAERALIVRRFATLPHYDEVTK